MIKNILEMEHHADDYECMWNGIEDLYIQRAREKLPPSLFFILAGFGSFCYMKTPKSELKRRIALGDGRTKQMYQFLAPIVGFEYTHYEYSSFEQALNKAKKEIDSGHPPVLGALDMYYIPYYPTLYYKQHIPFHYVLMIGYDDKKKIIYVLDCGRKERQEISYDTLKNAWDCNNPGLSKPFTICKIRMHSNKNKYQIAKEALVKKGELFLYPNASFVGVLGFQKFIEDLPKWKTELTKEEYDKILMNMVTFFGSVPTLPNALLGIKEPDTIKFGGGFDKMGRVLNDLGTEFNNESWIEIAQEFNKGAHIIDTIKNSIVDYLLGIVNNTDDLPILFTRIKDIMINSYTLLINSSK